MPQMTLQQAFALGVQHHQAGQFQEAESILRQILSAQPNHADALHFLGLIAYQTGRAEMGIALLNRAISINPQSAYYCNLGKMLAESQRVDEAIKSYHEAIRLGPDNFEAFHQLSAASLAGNQLDAAIDAAHRALKLRPSAHETLSNLGQALHKKGQREEAIAALRRSIEISPQYAPAYMNLGIVLQLAGDIAGATHAFTEAIWLDPNRASYRINFGKLMQLAGDQDVAVDAFNQAIALAPQNHEGYFNLGNALHAQSRYVDAVAAFRKAIELKPNDAGLWNNLAMSFHAQADYASEIEAYEKAVSLDPDSPLVRYNLGLTRLLLGDFEKGWKGYEYRIRTKELETDWLQFDRPRWNGEQLNGRRILIHAEQALGDTMQFVRYLPQVAQRGGKIILQVQPELSRLLKNFRHAEQVVARGDPLPEFDLQCPLLSLPLILRCGAEIPNEIPYIASDAQAAERWHSHLINETRLKVGLFWQGKQKPDPRRSIRLAELAPLAQMKHIAFISLQVGQGSDQANAPPPGMDLTDWTSEISDFSDTAGLIENLDLVISIDSSVAHLAGAVGKPVWALLPFVPDWRWMLDRSDSPWYPTARLFRQTEPGNWQHPVQSIFQALQTFKPVI